MLDVSGTADRLAVAGVTHRMRVGPAGILLAAIAALLLALALSGGGRDIVPWTGFRIVVLGLLAYLLAARGVDRTPLTYPLMGVLAAVAGTSIGSVRPQSSVDQFIVWTTYVAEFFFVATALSSLTPTRDPGRAKQVEWARRFVDAGVFAGGILSLVALYWFWGAGTPTMRWYSTFYWPNPFAGFLLLILPVEVLRAILAESRRGAIAHGAMSVLLGTAFILTYSRGAWVAGAVAAGLAAVVLRASIQRETMIRAGVLMAALVAAVFLLTGGQAFRSPAASVFTRAASTADLNEYSLQGRLQFLRGAAEIFRDHPVVGTGPGTYTFVYPQYQRDIRFYARDAHNLAAQVAAESGIVGLGALLWLMAALAALGVRVIRRARGTSEFPWVAGVTFGLGAFWLHTGMEMNWSFPAAPAMAFALMGVLAGYDTLTASAAALTLGGRWEHVERRPSGIWARIGELLAAVGIIAVMVVTGLQYAAASVANRMGSAGAFAQAMRLSPLDPRYPSSLADALGSAGVPPAARIPLVQRARGLDRTNPYYWFQLALLVAQLPGPDAADEAEKLLRTAITLDPFHYPEAYRHLAALYRRQANPAAALEVYQQAAARYPDVVAQDFALRPQLWPWVVALWMDWANLLTEQRRGAEAEAIYSRISRLEPRFAPSYIALARLLMAAGRSQDAARVVDAGLSQSPSDGQLQALRRALRAGK